MGEYILSSACQQQYQILNPLSSVQISKWVIFLAKAMKVVVGVQGAPTMFPGRSYLKTVVRS